MGSPRTREELAAAAGTLEVAEGSPVVDDGVQANSAPIQAPQPPHAATLVDFSGKKSTTLVVGNKSSSRVNTAK
ncbi:hypothetical protein Tco_1519358, partial [Tanacetum coccineum]